MKLHVHLLIKKTMTRSYLKVVNDKKFFFPGEYESMRTSDNGKEKPRTNNISQSTYQSEVKTARLEDEISIYLLCVDP